MRGKGTVLIVDDEAYVRDSLAAVLTRRGFSVRLAGGFDEALAARALDGADVVLTDLKMPGKDGLALLRRLAEVEPGLPVVVLTGHGTVPSAVECMQAGAADYLLKPADPQKLVMVLERAMGTSRMRRELEYLRDAGDGLRRQEPLGVSAAWREVLRMAEIAAPTDTSVLILGESGTGKEEVAQLLHRRSRRAAGPFVGVNCAAIPTELFESEFFGHRRGAFTGAVADRVGRFRVAHQGTLFLDEINSLPPVAQAKVLRVLQDGVFERVGDSRPTVVDVRLICATNADLAGEVEAGRFRADLYYRINVLTLHIPPLRERREDIPVLAQAFLEEFSARLGKRVRVIHPEALAALDAYSWPGNVRELRNVMERGVLLEETDQLLPSSLPPEITGGRPGRQETGLNLRQSLLAEERRLLGEALRQAGGVRRQAARLLGIDERNLAYFLKKHGLGRRRRSPELGEG